jgi:hypothetical protein
MPYPVITRLELNSRMRSAIVLLNQIDTRKVLAVTLLQVALELAVRDHDAGLVYPAPHPQVHGVLDLATGNLRHVGLALDVDCAHPRAIMIHRGCADRKAAYQACPAHNELNPIEFLTSASICMRRRSCRPRQR